MRGFMRSLLQRACAGGGKVAVWQVVQHTIMSGDKQYISEIIDFVKEYPDFWPEEFRSRILKMSKQEKALLTKFAHETYLYERLNWLRNEEVKMSLRRDYEATHRDYSIPPEHIYLYISDPEPRPS